MDQHRVVRVGIAKGAHSTVAPSGCDKTEKASDASNQDQKEVDRDSISSDKEITE
jgi:hypothetical protein